MTAPSPMNLDPLPVAGATIYGVRVLRVRLELEDGRTQKLELPRFDPVGEEEGKSEMILEVIHRLDKGERLPGKTLSGRAGVKWNSDTRAKLSAMVRDGLISHDDNGYGTADK